MLFTSRLIVCWRYGTPIHGGRHSGLSGCGVQSNEIQILSWSCKFSMGFRSGESSGHSILGNPSLHHPFPNDATLMSWSIVVHEDEIRPVLLMQAHNDWITDVIQVVWACHCTTHWRRTVDQLLAVNAD
ncbi:hypothetical protein XENOCAPTIV_002493 [Xenoophorus captivus]|uniref:Uncharacterized protein n=1 Tax=Xenoophorus captivus TaxID=1517983 RepID=A0ABV0RFD2_9TELE